MYNKTSILILIIKKYILLSKLDYVIIRYYGLKKEHDVYQFI